MPHMNHRKPEAAYGVTVDVIGQTKVTGQHYLTDSLANSVLNRQLEKQLPPGVAKFLPDRLHFSRSETGGQRTYRRDIPYYDVKKFYTFPGRSDTFMLCVEGDYEGGRIYQSFRCRSSNDLNSIKTMIYGEPTHPQNTRHYDNGVRPSNVVYAVEPSVTKTVIEQPQYAYVTREYVQQPPPLPSKPPSPIYVERVSTVMRERTPSPVYVRRVSAVRTAPPAPPSPPPPIQQPVYTRPVYVQEQVQEPVILRRVQKPETVVQQTYIERVPTVVTQREPSPMVVRRSASRPASVVYVEDSGLADDTVHVERVRTLRHEISPAPIRRISITRPTPTPPPRNPQIFITDTAPETVTVIKRSPVMTRRSSYSARPVSIVYADNPQLQEVVDESGNLVLKRVSRIYSSTRY